MELNEGLAKAAAIWIKRHGLSQTTIAALGGPSTTSMTKIGSGRGSVRPGSLVRLDKAFGWEVGTSAQYLDGLDPQGLFTEPAPATLHEWSDEQLLDELRQRLARAREGETNDESAAQEKMNGPAGPGGGSAGHSIGLDCGLDI